MPPQMIISFSNWNVKQNEIIINALVIVTIIKYEKNFSDQFFLSIDHEVFVQKIVRKSFYYKSFQIKMYRLQSLKHTK
jgi:hypothetical protein